MAYALINQQIASYHSWRDYYGSRINPHRMMEKLQQFSPDIRYQKLSSVAGTHLGRHLLLDRDPAGKLFEGFSDRQTSALWQKFVRSHNKRELLYDTKGLKPSSAKVVALLDAFLTIEEAHFSEGLPRAEFIAKLAAFFKWDDLTAGQKAHPLFAGALRSDISQKLTAPSKGICDRAERLLCYQIEEDRVVLVNDHLLAKRDEIPLTLCLRTFITPEGNIFIKGNSYAPLDPTNRNRITDLFPRFSGQPTTCSATHLPGITLSPNRHFLSYYYSYFDLEEIARDFPKV